MSRRSLTIRKRGVLIGACALLVCSSCGKAPRQEPPSLLPDLTVARQAVESALDEWRASPQADTTSATRRSLIFVDQQRQPGQRLREFAILGESEVDNCRRFVVRLSLAEPDESMLAAYFVFGKDPIWVYRAEDFDMTMQMDTMPDEPPRPAGESRSASGPRSVR